MACFFSERIDIGKGQRVGQRAFKIIVESDFVGAWGVRFVAPVSVMVIEAKRNSPDGEVGFRES